MQIFPTRGVTNSYNTSFKGVFSNYYSIGSLQNNDYWHKNSSLDKTLGSYHANPTYKAYYADPMEYVPDSIKEKVDYVVYDNEPAYPDVNEEVSKNYFGTQRKNYKKDFEEIRQYYYRREMGGHADKAEAQYQQWQAAECVRLYDKAGDLRYKKETAEDEIHALEAEIKNASDIELPVNKKLLKQEKETEARLSGKIDTLNQKDAKYAELKQIINDGADVSTEEEKTFIVSQINKTKRNLMSAQNELNECRSRIKSLESYITGFPKWLQGKQNEIKAKQSAIEGFKAKLIPLFDELKNFYIKQGIKVIK